MTTRSDEPLSAGSSPGPDSGRGRADEAGAADAVARPSASGSGGAAVPSADAPDSRAADGPADDLPADDPVDDLPAVADGEGMSPVVREYVERLRSEALARDAELRARGIDPYKGTPVDGGPAAGWARLPWRYW